MKLEKIDFKHFINRAAMDYHNMVRRARRPNAPYGCYQQEVKELSNLLKNKITIKELVEEVEKRFGIMSLPYSCGIPRILHHHLRRVKYPKKSMLYPHLLWVRDNMPFEQLCFHKVLEKILSED